VIIFPSEEGPILKNILNISRSPIPPQRFFEREADSSRYVAMKANVIAGFINPTHSPSTLSSSDLPQFATYLESPAKQKL